ncbi:lysyl oxidase family protein [Actinocrispum wychmicini]|uniref:Lysyl oxidase n=1 Tax=Actinocrispum wychmicini TaxID=1213861 RepID=A0A4R2IVQ4_9PSEU|nr:lysyl oxidase family protein [Actinocrispum wychmicini]TCO49753.1 lysyl oxidase [Actinocrispum wychmicini]
MRSWIVGAAGVLAAMVVIPPAQAGEQLMLPDLRQAPPGCPGGYDGDPNRCWDWDVCMVADADAPNGNCVTDGDVRAVRLRFTTAEDNIGDGPLLLYGHRDAGATMQVRQAIQSGRHGPIPGSYGDARQATTTSMYYEPAPMHQHWHLMNFERMQLRTPNGDIVVTDRKNGFCLGDRYKVPDTVESGDDTPEHNLALFLRDNMCGHHNTAATDIKAGISAGQGDDYRFDVDFQWLDITHVPSGTYDLVNTVDSDHTLLEKDYTNNSSAAVFSIQWPRYAKNAPAVITEPPRVRLLRSCPGRERCAASG